MEMSMPIDITILNECSVACFLPLFHFLKLEGTFALASTPTTC